MSKRRGLQTRAAEGLKRTGFVPLSGTVFTRQVGEQFHFVGLQYRQSSSEITFNLGCHFTGVRSLFDYQPVAAEDLELLDCGLRVRVGDYIGDGLYDVWWDPNNAEVPAALAQASWAIERAFNDCIKRWGDGTRMLQSDVKVHAGSIRLSRALLRWTVHKHCFHTYSFLSMLAHARGNDALAGILYEKSLLFDHFPKNGANLTAALRARRKRGNQRGQD